MSSRAILATSPFARMTVRKASKLSIENVLGVQFTVMTSSLSFYCLFVTFVPNILAFAFHEQTSNLLQVSLLPTTVFASLRERTFNRNPSLKGEAVQLFKVWASGSNGSRN